MENCGIGKKMFISLKTKLLSQIVVHQLLNLLDDINKNALFDIAFEVIQKLRILFDDILCGSEQCIQPVGKLLTSEDLLYERSFESFEGVKFMDGGLGDFLDTTANQKVHTGREF